MIIFTERNVGNIPKLVVEANSIEHLMKSPYMKLRWGAEDNFIKFADNGNVLWGVTSDTMGVVGYWKSVS